MTFGGYGSGETEIRGITGCSLRRPPVGSVDDCRRPPPFGPPLRPTRLWGSILAGCPFFWPGLPFGHGLVIPPALCGPLYALAGRSLKAPTRRYVRASMPPSGVLAFRAGATRCRLGRLFAALPACKVIMYNRTLIVKGKIANSTFLGYANSNAYDQKSPSREGQGRGRDDGECGTTPARRR